MSIGGSSRLLPLTAGLLAAAAVAPVALAAKAAPLSAVVRVTIHGHPQGNVEVPGKVFYSPDRVKVGTLVTFMITNHDSIGHDFEIDGVTSRTMGHNGGRAVIKVLFKRAGTYFGSCIDDNHSGIGGNFVVT